MPRLCLNMIVKNEAAILGRCLHAAAPFLDRYAILDTGSTDGTQALIRRVMAAHGVPGEIRQSTFRSFDQARNEALALARETGPADDMLLLCDADMELVVEDREFRDHLEHPLYTVRQESGLSYWNVRLLRADLDARYVGVTHEYVSAPAHQHRFDGIWFLDHADGGSRAEKFARDIRLLTEDLRRDPDNGRSLFYLGQSYKDAGQAALAIPAYERRIAVGGWDEELWYARYMIAECHQRLGNEAEFVRASWEAYDARPTRAEPLLKLATHFRVAGKHDACLAACELAETIPYPSDTLFVEPTAYHAGFAWERSVSGFYSRLPERKAAGREACFRLTTSRRAEPGQRARALDNATFYARLASELFPGAGFVRLEPETPTGFVAMNPSVAIQAGRRWCVVRFVNYTVLAHGGYDIRGPRVETRNAVLELDADGAILTQTDIDESADPGPVFPTAVVGFEDCRLTRWRDAWWLSASCRDRHPDAVNEMVLVELDDAWRFRRVIEQRSYQTDRYQKNWMPLVRAGALEFVYLMEPLTVLRVDPATLQAQPVSVSTLAHLDLSAFRGGSQLVPVAGGWLAMTHETADNTGPRRQYLHRFVRFDEHLGFAGMTEPFVIHTKGIEFCAGLALDEQRGELIASFGVNDAEAWIATIPVDEVLRQIRFD